MTVLSPKPFANRKLNFKSTDLAELKYLAVPNYLKRYGIQ